jgi:large subunit ribosomal protein L6
MSRIGKAPITVPQGTSIEVDKGNVVKVKGPKGELMQKIEPGFELSIEDGEAVLVRPTEQKRHKALHGLYRSLINNMVIGCSVGITKELELIGVGYRASNTGNLLEISVGYSHPIYFYVPDEIDLTTEMEKGKAPKIKLSGVDGQLVGQVAAKIRSFRKPEPYKGKGIKYIDEQLRRKAGKTAAK